MIDKQMHVKRRNETLALWPKGNNDLQAFGCDYI